MRAAIAGLGALLVLAAAGPAAAKEVEKAQVCGATGCREVNDREQLLALAEGGPPTAPPDRPSPWYRAEVTVRGDGELFTFPLAIVPDAELIRGSNDDGTYTWMPVSDGAVQAFRELTRGLEPLPAARLGGLDAPDPAQARVSEVFTVDSPETAGDGSVLPWLAGGIGAIALVAAALLLARRRGVRLRLWPPGSTRPT